MACVGLIVWVAQTLSERSWVKLEHTRDDNCVVSAGSNLGVGPAMHEGHGSGLNPSYENSLESDRLQRLTSVHKGNTSVRDRVAYVP